MQPRDATPSRIPASPDRIYGAVVLDPQTELRPPWRIGTHIGSLNLKRSWSQLASSPYRLLRSDFEFLRRNYVPHWGLLWVAGKRFEPSGGAEQVFEVIV